MSETVVINDSTTVVVTQPAPVVVTGGQMGVRGPRGLTGTGGAIGHYGSFLDTTDQTLTSLSAGQTVRLNTTVEANGISIDTSSGIVFSTAGTYSLTFSLQLANTDNTPSTADVWVEYNGVNYPDSNTRFDVPGRKNVSLPGHAVATVNFVATATAGGIVRLKWVGSTAGVSLETIPATTIAPQTPSVILTITQVMYTQAGPQGPQGPQGPSGDASSIAGYPVQINNPNRYDMLQLSADNVWINSSLLDGGNF